MYCSIIITPLPLPLAIPITPSPIIQHLNFWGVNTTALRELGGFGAAGGLVVGAVFFTVVGLFGIKVTAVAGFVQHKREQGRVVLVNALGDESAVGVVKII